MNKTVLFIEDEAPLQKTVSEALHKEGIRVISALNGEEGVQLAQRESPNLVVLDLMLPGVPGEEVLKRLKSDETTSQIPVIVLTNSEDMQDIQAAIDMGASAYLVKINYKLEELVQKIKENIAEG